MIITLTPNPSLDRTYAAETIHLGGINRAHATRVDAGGKGLNVTRALTAAGTASIAIFPAGGPDGAQMIAELAASHVPAHPVPVDSDTRSNVTLVDASGTTTKINAPGDTLSSHDVSELLDALRDEVAQATAAGRSPVVVGAGSLPAGLDDDFYGHVAEVCTGLGARVVLDTSGAPLARAVETGGLELIKPNDEELAELTGRELVTVGDVVDAATQVIDRGTRSVLVSLGAHGLMLVRREHADAAPGDVRTWWAGGDALVPRSTVGAGDCTLAGYLSVATQEGDRRHGVGSPLLALQHAAAWGRAAVLLPGSAVPTPNDLHLDEVRTLTDPPRRIALKEL